MWSAPNRQKLEANDSGDHAMDFLSLGEVGHKQLLAKA
jgi:hypothetical protein